MNPDRRSRPLLEICVTSLDYALAAQRAGADRIELCSDLKTGGVTPGGRLMETAREQLHIPIHVLIRPRPGDFVYSAREFRAIRQSIQTAQRLKLDAIVVGILDRNSRVDIVRTRELVELAHPLPVTFHRAFDRTDRSRDALEAVIQTGARRLLTSGGGPKATGGLANLARLVSEAGSRLIIMAGGGIAPANIPRVLRSTQVRELHGTLLTSALRKEQGPGQRRAQVERYYRRVLEAASMLQQLR